MLIIDGSTLEGGGQILRTAIALSALRGTPLTVTRIRANRSKPGLAPQHMTAIRAVASLCDARTDGLFAGSTMLRFTPQELRPTEITVDVGTAGSIPLVLQAWLSPALLVGGSIIVRGGTEVQYSPTIDYFERVFLPVLRCAGAQITLEIRKRGYYPQGGGEVWVSLEPSSLQPLEIREDDRDAGILSCSQNLPDHVAQRQADAAMNRLQERLDFSPPIHLDRRKGVSTGTSCTVWWGAKGGISLGKPGLAAERVGEAAADALIRQHRADGLVDTHLADQLLLYLAQYGGRYTTSELSLHTKTMLWLLKEFEYTVHTTPGDPVELSA
jgi:RNA 3'-terminal phosphate cyclase (ATP)